MSRWHLQVWRTTWVFWGYGPEPSVVHVAPAMVVLKDLLPSGDMHFPFELPVLGPNSTLPPPKEYERREGFGWRFQSEAGSGHDWRFASSEEEAIEAAKTSLSKQRFDTQELMAPAFADIRRTHDEKESAC